MTMLTVTVRELKRALENVPAPEAAAAVYDVAAAAHFGAFAFTNKRAGVLV